MNDFKESIKVKCVGKPQERKMTDREARRFYEEFIFSQENQFLLFINYLNKQINELKEKGVISPFLQLYARIKATNSALKNYDKKELDDIFGIEFVCATEREISIVRRLMEEIMVVLREKIHDKENGYKAIHNLCSMNETLIKKLNDIAEGQNMPRKNSDDFPIVEVQYKTVEVFYEANFGKASHEKYKDTKIPQLQALYDADSLTVGEYIPYMWISDSTHDEMRELTTEEVLKKMYPSLRLKKDTSKQKNENQMDIGR